jgi:hypothetical protein
MSIEAMTLALEALENGKAIRHSQGGTKYQPDLEEGAITALRQAIEAYPKTDKVDMFLHTELTGYLLPLRDEEK